MLVEAVPALLDEPLPELPLPEVLLSELPLLGLLSELDLSAVEEAWCLGDEEDFELRLSFL